MTANSAQHERAGLCDLFEQVGPDAPTLCGEWKAVDLAAHLYLRERRLDAAGGIVIGQLAGYTERVQRRLRDRMGFEALVEAVRRGPPLPLRLAPVDRQVNTVEYFVHHEDVRRAAPGFSPRPGDPVLDGALWPRLRASARLMLRHAGTAVVLRSEGYGVVSARPGEDPVTVSGPPGELLLFCFGRQPVAQVELAGDPAKIEGLGKARLGL